MSILKKNGPGFMVAAAFIGPGTVVTATQAGASFGLSLLWAIAFSVLATIVLQEMTVRLGIISGKGLSQSLMASWNSVPVKVLVGGLVMMAIFVGNSAYEAGNITGTVIGISMLLGEWSVPFGGGTIRIWPLIIGLTAFFLLNSNSFRLIEGSLVALVAVMGLIFFSAAFTALLVVPSGYFEVTSLLPQGSMLTIMSLIGTTVVPYNLFLHSNAAAEKWKHPSDIRAARKDLLVAIIAGGMITAAIVITSSAAFFNKMSWQDARLDARQIDIMVLGSQLEPLLGSYGKYVISAGLFCAGITSAITAPLAVAYTLCGIFGWKSDLASLKFRLTWAIVLFLGVFFSSIGLKPVTVILFAQFANGLLLPVVAVFLLAVMNNTRLLGKYKNGMVANILGTGVVMIAFLLGLKSILSVFGIV